MKVSHHEHHNMLTSAVAYSSIINYTATQSFVYGIHNSTAI